MTHPEDANFTYATDTDWDRSDARQCGGYDADVAWVLTDRDVWHRNPFYNGPAVPHPEDDYDYDGEDKDDSTHDDATYDYDGEDIPF